MIKIPCAPPGGQLVVLQLLRLSAEIEVAFLSFCAINYLILEDKVIFVSTYCIL